MARPILITRPEPEASQMAELCHARGLKPVVTPVMHIVSVPQLHLPAHDGICLTSPHALSEQLVPLIAPGTLFHVVGARAAAKVRGLGFPLATEAAHVAALEAALLRHLRKGQRLLYLSGEHITRDFSDSLAARGVSCARLVTYRALPVPQLSHEAKQLLAAGAPAAVFLGSIRTAELFAALAGSRDALAGCEAVCLSRAIAEAAGRLGFGQVFYGDTLDIGSLLDAYCSAHCANP